MKHLARTLLCVVLAAAMVFALGAGAFAASVDNAKHYDTYAFIGDSIAAGHSLPEYTAAAGIGDDILVKEENFESALQALGEMGYEIGS